MILQTKEGEKFSLKKHKTLPNFMDTAVKHKVKIDGKNQEFLLHPNKPDSPRVSLVIGDTRFYRDDAAFKNLVTSGAGEFSTVERASAEDKPKKERAPKAAKAPKAEAKGKEPLLKPKEQKAKAKSATAKSTERGFMAPMRTKPCSNCGKKEKYAVVNGKSLCHKCATE